MAVRRNVPRSPAEIAASIAEMTARLPRRPAVDLSASNVPGSSTMTPYILRPGGSNPSNMGWTPYGASAGNRPSYTAPLPPRDPWRDFVTNRPSRAALDTEQAIVDAASVLAAPQGETTEEYLARMFGTIVGGGNRGGGGGGGGGSGSAYSRPTNPDPLGWGAIQSAQQTEQAYRDMIAAEQRMRESAEARLTGRRTGAAGELAAAKQRADQLLAELNAANELAGGRVTGVYSAGDAALAQVMMDVENALRSRTQGAGETLAMFGADPRTAMPGGTSAVEFAGAGRANLAQMGASDQAYFAGRPQAYAGLGMDINTLREAAYQNVLNQIAAEEEQIRRDAEQRTAELERQRAQAILEIQQREAERAGQYA